MHIRTDHNTNIDVDGITLLSVEEAGALPEKIRKCDVDWWLRSKGFYFSHAAFVDGKSGDVRVLGDLVFEKFGIRPALKFNRASTTLQIGSKIKIFDYNWTVISDSFMLCDNVIETSAFRKENYMYNKAANDYEKSDVKKWLENWYTERLKAQTAQ